MKDFLSDNNCYSIAFVAIQFWVDTCTTRYELIVLNGQTTTSGFYKVVQQQH